MNDPRLRRLLALGLILFGLGLVSSLAIVLYVRNRPAEVGFPRV